MDSDPFSPWKLHRLAQDAATKGIHLKEPGRFQHQPAQKAEVRGRRDGLFLLQCEIQLGQDVVVPLTMQAMKQLAKSIEAWKLVLQNDDLEQAKSDQKPS